MLNVFVVLLHLSFGYPQVSLGSYHNTGSNVDLIGCQYPFSLQSKERAPWNNFCLYRSVKSMFQAEFSVDIAAPGASKFKRDGHQYVALPNMSQYSIIIRNGHHTRCDAVVQVDGEKIGQWVVQAHSSITIDRPAGIARRFTFVDETSRVARTTGAVVGREMNGVVSVIFKPAKEQPVHSTPRLSAMSAQHSSLPEMRRLGSGVTVLGDESSQRFGTKRALTSREIDWQLCTEVALRLVVKTQKYIPVSPRAHYPPRLD